MQKGQILIEAILALVVAVVIISAISGAAITSVNNSSFSRDQNQATDYATQGIEVLRQQSETNWTNFSTYRGTYCFDSNSTLTSGTCSSANLGGSANNYFVRQVQITQNSPKCGAIATEVSVTVSWADGKCINSSTTYCHQVSLNSCLANIGAVPAP